MQARQKGGEIMKIATTFLAALVFAGSVGAGSAFAAADGVLSDAPLSADGYCHLRFPVIDDNTLASSSPTLDPASDDNVIDFYGTCNENPTGANQVQEQKRQAQFRFGREYMDGGGD
jgi:hypothetical protein